MSGEAGAAEGRLLAPLTEDTFLHNLQTRFHRDIIYKIAQNAALPQISIDKSDSKETFENTEESFSSVKLDEKTWVHGAGGPVVCVNPGRPLPLYSAAEARKHAVGGSAAPHVYGVLAAAARGRQRGRPQLVLVTGVSGAGKTEAARLSLQAAVVGGGNSAAGARLAAAGTLLEAFGNAATALNHNASRFGKLLDIEYDYKDEIVGGHITHYLLERSRCGRVCEGERSFHVFYQLLAGADCRTLRSLRLQRGSHVYRALGGGAAAADEAQDAAHFAFTSAAMSALGMDERTRNGVWQVLAFLLKLGQLEFMPAHNVDGTLGVRVRNHTEVEEACDVVGIDTCAVLRAIGAGGGGHHGHGEDDRTGGAGGAQGGDEESEAGAHAEWAESARDALMGAVYERLFSWLVAAANGAGGGHGGSKGPPLGILDMYGLESLRRNGLERLLVNCAAERVQAMAARCTLVLRREREALDEVIGCAGGAGGGWCEPAAVTLLGEMAAEVAPEEECTRRRDDHAYDHFTVQHFGGSVRYSGVRREDSAERGAGAAAVRRLAGAARASRCVVLSALFPDGSPRRSPRRPAPRVCRQSALLCALEARATTCDVRVIHCVKADVHNRAGRFDATLVRHQLRTQSIVEMSLSMREGWDEWLSARELVARFGVLGRCGGPVGGDACRRARALLRSLPLPAGEFAFGRNNVYIRNSMTLLLLEQWRVCRVCALVRGAQRWWRARVSQRRANVRRRMAAVVIQRAYRRHCARVDMKAGALKDKAAAVIQRCCRLWVRRRYLCTLWSRLPVGHLSPQCRLWPQRVPAHLRRTHQLLAALHHRWRCHRYRLSFDQTARNRMREKVTASILFKDKKQSYPCSVAHPFVGDYVRLRASPMWAAGGADGYVVFADVVGKVSRDGRVSPILAVLSTAALLLLEPRSLRVRRRLPAGRLTRLWLSPARDDLLAVGVAEPGAAGGCVPGRGGPRGDVLLRALHCIELATKLYLVVQHAAGAPPPVSLSPTCAITLHADVVSVTVHPRSDLPNEPRREPHTTILRRGSSLDVLL